MSSNVSPVPDGYHTITPYLMVQNAARAIEFYKQAFGATELFRLGQPSGQIGHAEIKIGDSIIMMADEVEAMGALSPPSLGGTPVHFCVYVEDVDTVFAQAIAAGGTEIRPLTNQFYGDRSGTLKDPFGHQWTVATHIEDVSPEEAARRMEEQMAGSS